MIMNPQEPLDPTTQTQQSWPPEPPLSQTPTPKKKITPIRIILLTVSLIILALVVIFVIGHRDDSKKSDTPQKSTKEAPAEFTISYAKKAPTYASNEVFDPCALLPFGIVQKTVPGFPESITDTPGKRYTSPIAIEHNYIDRDIAQPRGKDGQARSVSQTIGAPDTGRSMSNFTSLFDAKCAYGQGQPMSTTFVRLFVIQRPTSFAPEFLPFLAGLPKQVVNGVDVYTVTTPDSNGYMYEALVRADKQVAVIVQSGIADLLNTAAQEISKKITASPEGYAQFTYPGVYADLTDSCSLFTAADFEKYVKKPAAALAEEELLLTESEKFVVERTCHRIQADRSGEAADIATSDITLRQGKTAAAATNYLDIVKTDFTVTSAQQKIGDESYIRVKKSGSNPEQSYTYIIRKGRSIIELQVAVGSTGDTSTQAFEQRIKPAAQSAYKKFIEQME